MIQRNIGLFPPSYRWRWYHYLLFETIWACVCGAAVVVWVAFKVMGWISIDNQRGL